MLSLLSPSRHSDLRNYQVVVMQFLKKFIITFFIFILLVSSFLWGLTKMMSPEMMKTVVKQKITTLTNQPSEVKGSINWQLFPHPGIKIEKVCIGSKTALSPYVINLGQLLFNLKISALLQGKMVFNEIKIDNFIAKINLNKKPPTAAALIKQILTTPKAKLNGRFAIEKLLITHGKISINTTNNFFNFTSLQLGTEDINFQQDLFPLQIKTTIDYTFNQQKHAFAQLQFKGNASFNAESFNNLENLLQSTFLNGHLLIQNMQIGKFKINKLSANTLFKHAIVSLNPLTLDLYQGSAIGDLRYNFLSKILKINQTATGINGARLTFALFNQKLLKGKLDLLVHTQSNFNQGHWLNTTTGNGNISLHQGTIEMVNLDNIIKKISNIIYKTQENKEKVPALESESLNYPDFLKGTTPFKLMSIQYQLDQAVLSSNSIVLQTNALQLKGNGELNLTNNHLTSYLVATLKPEDDKINEIQNLLGEGSIPFLIQGNLNDPTILPDFKKINSSLTH